MSTEKKESKKSKLPVWIIAGVAVAALAIAAAIVIPKLAKPGEPTNATEGNETVAPTEEPSVEPTDTPSDGYAGDLYWNVERLKYAGKSEAGLSSRIPNKDDGYYHILLASNGRQMERRCADKKIVNLIDTQDIMGLIFDESGLITGIVPIMSIVDEFALSGMYVKDTPDGTMVELNSSSRLDGRENEVADLKGYKIYDVSGITSNFIGQEIGIAELLKMDRVFGVELPDGRKYLYVTERLTEVPVYWIVDRNYKSEIKSTGREPNADGDYEILVAIDGEQKIMKTKSRDVATVIDENPARCLTFTLDEEGYIKSAIDSAYALKGPVFASWGHVTAINGREVSAMKVSTDRTFQGTMAEDVKIFDVSPTSEYVGVPVTDLRPTDQIHGLKDQFGEIKYIFIVRRLTDVPIYWNHTRYYDSTNKVTTRKPDANGWYWFDVSVNGTVKKLKTNDKSVATKVDSFNTKCMGLVTDGDVILDTVTAEFLTCTGRGKSQASWQYVMSMTDAKHFHTQNTGGTASADVTIADDCQIYNVSKNTISHIGEKTTVQVGDQVHCILNLYDEASVIFVVNRPVQSPIYWNVSRWYDSTTKETGRTPDAEGWYHILFAVEGKQVDLKTQDKSIVNSIDALATKCMGLAVNGDVITKFYPAEACVNSESVVASWYEVTSIQSATQFHAKKTTVTASDYGKEADVTMVSNCKVWNVGGLYSYCGEAAKVQVGDLVHCLTNKQKQATTVFIVRRTGPDRTALCPDCGKEVKWTCFSSSISGKEGETVHYYLAANSGINSQVSVPKNVICHFDMNGYSLTCPRNDRGIVPWYEGSELVIMNQKTGSEAKLIGQIGSRNGTPGVMIWLRNETNKLTIRDVTIDGRTLDSKSQGIINVRNGELTLKNVKIYGGKNLLASSALYINRKAYLENVTVEGGTSDTGGSVYVGASGSLTLAGNIKISGGKTAEGTRNLAIAPNVKITIAEGGLTSAKGAIGVSAASVGAFTNNGVSAYQECFTSDFPSGTVGTDANGALTFDFEVTGIAFKEASATVAAGQPVMPEIVWTPGQKKGETVTFESSDPTVLTVTDSGDVIAVKDSAGKSVTLKATTSSGLTATMSVTVTAATDTTHYHAEATNADIKAGNGTKVSYTAWTDDTMFPTESGYWYLTKDVVIKNRLQPEIPAGTNVHICLNGHKIINETENNVLTINLFSMDGETLSICDCSDGETGSVEATGSYEIPGRAIWVRPNNTLNIYGGNYIGAESGKSGGGTLAVESGSTINFYGGTVKGGTSTVRGGNVYVNGVFNMYGGTITGGTAPRGGNIYVNTAGSLSVTGGTITGGTTTTGSGGNLYFYGKELTLKDCTVENGVAQDSGGNACITGEASDPQTILIENVTFANGDSATSTVKDSVHINGSAETITVRDSVFDCLDIMNAVSLTLEGKVLIGTASGGSFYIYNGTSGYQTPVTAGTLSADAKVYLDAPNTGVLVKNGAAVIDRFEQKRGEEYVLEADGDDVKLAMLSQHKHCICGGKLTDGHAFADGTTHACEEARWEPWGVTNLLPMYDDLKPGDNYFYLTEDVKIRTGYNWQPGYSMTTRTAAADLGDRTVYLCLNGHTVSTESQNILTSVKDTSPSVTHSSNLKVVVTDCADTPGKLQTIRQNTPNSAFAWLYGTNGDVTFYNVTLDGTAFTSTMNGGLMRVANGSRITLINVTVTGGETNASGLVYVADATSGFTMHGGSFTGGKAAEGGAIYARGAVALYGVTMTGCTAGNANTAHVVLNAPDAEAIIQDSEIGDGVLVKATKKLTLKGNVKIGTEGGVGLVIDNSSAAQEVVAEALADTAKIYVQALSDGVIIKGGAAYKEKFVNAGGGITKLVVNGDDLAYQNKYMMDVSGGTIEDGHAFPDGSKYTATEVEWKPWTSGTALPQYSDLEAGDNYYYLTGNVNLAAEWRPGLKSDSTYADSMDGRVIYLNLNGFEVTSEKTVFLNTQKSSGYTTNVKVVITDPKDAGGSVKMTKTGTLPSLAFLGGSGDELTVYNGTFDASEISFAASTSNMYGHMVRLYSTAKFTLYGGEMKFGTLNTDTKAGYGGIYADTNATVTIYGGKVSGGKVLPKTTSSSGKAVGGNISADGKVFLYGGEISGGKAKQGGNIYITALGRLTILGTEASPVEILNGETVGSTGGNLFTLGNASISYAHFDGGKASGSGGNIYALGSNKTLTIDHSVIENGIAGYNSSSNSSGGNICITYNTASEVYTVTFDHVTIKGGTASESQKRDVHLNAPGTTLTIKDTTIEGNIQIMNSKSTVLKGTVKIGTDTLTGLTLSNSGSYAPNVEVDSLTTSSSIGLYVSAAGTAVKNGAAYLDRFVLKRTGYVLRANGDDIEMVAE